MTPTAITRGGVYSQDVKWPANGTLFAEGNIRIRGDVTLPRVAAGQPDRFPSLTVASLGNIYIEGKLSVDDTFNNPGPNQTIDPDRKKLMLLAKKNVIVNPTRAVLARTDVQTVATNQAPVEFNGVFNDSVIKSIGVANPELFNVGDYVTIGTGQNKNVRGVITQVFLQNREIELRTHDTFIVPPAGTANIFFTVRSALEERVADDPTNPIPDNFFSLVDTVNAINRRVLSPVYQGTRTSTTNNNNKLVFNHFAERKQTAGKDDGLNVKAEDFTPTLVPRPSGFVAQLTNKQLLQGSTDDNNTVPKSVLSSERILRTYNNYPALPNATNKKEFTSTAAKDITAFAAEISLTSENNLPSPNPQGYKYTATANEFSVQHFAQSRPKPELDCVTIQGRLI